MSVTFSARELEDAELANQLALHLRPDPAYFFALYSELAEQLPPQYLATLLDVSLSKLVAWRRAGAVQPRWHRPVQFLHLMLLRPGETNLFQIAAWGRLREPQFTKHNNLHRAIIGVFVELGEIAPNRVLPLLRNKVPGGDKRIETALTVLFESNQLVRNPVNGNWRADLRCQHAWHLLRARERREQQGKIVQMPAA